MADPLRINKGGQTENGFFSYLIRVGFLFIFLFIFARFIFLTDTGRGFTAFGWFTAGFAAAVFFLYRNNGSGHRNGFTQGQTRHELEKQFRGRTLELCKENVELRHRMMDDEGGDSERCRRCLRDKIFHAVAESASDAIISADRSGNIIYVNSSAELMFGHTKDEMLGRPITILMPERYRKEHLRSFSRYMATGKSIIIGKTVEVSSAKNKNGEEFPIELSLSTWKMNDEVFFAAIIRDITERKTAEKAILKSADEIEDLYNNAPCGYHSLYGDGTFARINNTELEWFGYARHEVIGKMKITDMMTADGVKIFHKTFPVFKERGWMEGLEIPMKRRDGSTFPVLLSATAIKDKDGNFIMSRSTIFDISERKSAEETLRDKEERFRQLAENIEDVFWMFDSETGKAVYVSPAYQNLWGTSPERVYEDASAWMESVYAEDKERVREAFSRLGAGTRNMEYRIMRPDGVVRWVWDRTFPIKNKDGYVHRIVRITHDATDRKFMMDALSKAYHDASLGRFAATVAHQVNNPLAAMKAGITLLADEVRPVPGAMPRLDIISGQVDRISRTVKTLLGFVRQRAVRTESVSINDVVSTVTALFEGSMHSRGIHLRTSLPDDLPAIQASVDDVQEILVTLLQNAQEAITDGGTVTVSVAEASDGVELSVEDNGPGLGPDPDKVFTPFHTTKPAGTGLGLTIIRNICESYSGHIQARNRDISEGGGAQFTVFLPCDKEENAVRAKL